MILRVMSWLALTAITGGCGNKPMPADTVNGSGSNAATAATPTPAPTTPATTTTTTATAPTTTTIAPTTPATTTTTTTTTTAATPPTAMTTAAGWALDSKPFVLTCGDKSLALPKPAAMPAVPPERPLPRDRPISVCRDQKSAEAVCRCLAGAVAKWADGLHAPATCKPIAAHKAASVQLLEIRSRPADAETTAGGVAFVVAGMHGGKWSAIDAIETAPELDLGVTPHASNDAAIDRFETRPRPDATLVWIESRHQTEETAMGDYTRTGEARTTVCVVPDAASAFCYVSVPRSAWDYTEAITNPAAGCTVRSATSFDHHLEDEVLTVRLTHGTDLKSVGRFRL